MDLEDTVITPVMTGWPNAECINIEKVRAVIAQFKPDRINIFSFAIWDSRQRELFNMFTRGPLQKALGIEFNIVLAVDEDIIPVCCKQTNLHPDRVDFQEMSNFWGKQGAFRLCMRNHAANLHRHGQTLITMLLDDAVFDELIQWPDLDTRVIITNIDQLTIS